MTDLSQLDADHLFDLKKKRTRTLDEKMPGAGQKASVLLSSLDGREAFHLDITRNQLKLTKVTMQNRARTIVILARLDIDGSPHRNPDDVEVPCPHLHLYREGYDDKWAFPVPTGRFSDLTDLGKTLSEFMSFCNIVEPPVFKDSLL